MKKITAFLLVLALAGGITTMQSCQSSKSSTASKMLKFNLEKGKGYDYEMTINMDQELMGQKMKMDMSSYYSMNVNGEEGDNKVITTTFERFKLGMDMGMMNLDVDTDKPMPEGDDADMKKNPMKMINRVFGAIKGRKFIMKVNSEGQVVEVSGFKEMANSIVDSMGLEGEEMAQVKEQMKQSFDKQFNDADMKSQFERMFYIFPNKQVKVGDSWEKTTTTSGQMPAKYNSTYTVKEIEGDMVTLEEKSKIQSSNEKMEMKGTVEGTLVVDSRSGLVVSADQDMDMTASVGGQDVKIKGVTKIKGKAN